MMNQEKLCDGIRGLIARLHRHAILIIAPLLSLVIGASIVMALRGTSIPDLIELPQRGNTNVLVDILYTFTSYALTGMVLLLLALFVLLMLATVTLSCPDREKRQDTGKEKSI